MAQLPVVHKTKLTKEQTYFVNSAELSRLLAKSPQYGNIELRFSDDPSLFKSNYDRFVKQEKKVVIFSVRYFPPPEEPAAVSEDGTYRITVYATLKTIRDELIERFQKDHFLTMVAWINEPRDATWRLQHHAIQFLIDLNSEEIVVDHDIDFDSYSRHSRKQRFRVDGRKHG